MDKSKLRNDIDWMLEEYSVLNQIEHPGIVKYYESYTDSKHVYLAMEYISGQPLFTKITEQNSFSEVVAAKYMKQLFEAVNSCHAELIKHRDIRPDNILITDNDCVRLIDFGFSRAMKPSSQQKIKTVVGMPYYLAPEALEGSFEKKGDIWSLGVVLYTLVSGYLPFEGANQSEVFAKIQNGSFDFNHPEFEAVSDDCKDLITKMLTVNEEQRISGIEALQHPWILNFGAMQTEEQPGDFWIGGEVINRLKSFKSVSTLKKAAMNLLMKTAGEVEVHELRKAFEQIDADGSGLISAVELQAVLAKN
jgi:calcium-dependent protein kinase